MSELYENKTVVVPEYNFDRIKGVINDYLSKNPLEEKWSSGTVYSRQVECTGINIEHVVSDEEDLFLELKYTDENELYENIDEDLPSCKRFDKFLEDLSEQLPEKVRILIPFYYYSK